MNALTHLAQPPRLVDGAERAAALVLALGPEAGAKLLATLDDGEVRRVTDAVARLGRLPEATLDALLAEVEAALGAPEPLAGGAQAARGLVAAALPPERADPILATIEGGSPDLWRALARLEPARLAEVLAEERPAVAAVALAKLPASAAAAVLAALPGPHAAAALAKLDVAGPIPEAGLRVVEEALRAALLEAAPPPPPAGGSARVAEILDAAPRELADRRLADLAALDGAAAERVRAARLVFEDLYALDAGGIAALARRAPRDKLVLALVGAEPAFVEALLGTLPQRAARVARDDLESLAEAKPRDVEAARSALVVLAKSLAAEGELEIKRGGSR